MIFHLILISTTAISYYPLSLPFFTASVTLGKAALQWKTATEVSNYGFDVERRNVVEPRSSEDVDGVIKAGEAHRVTFDASRLPSGLYHYRLESGNSVLMKKLIFMK